MIIKIPYTNTFLVEDFLKTLRSHHIQLEFIMMDFINLRKQVSLDNWPQLKILKESHIEMRIIKKSFFKHSSKLKRLKDQTRSYFKVQKILNVEGKNGVSELTFLIQIFLLIKQEGHKQNQSMMNRNSYFLMKTNINLLKILYFEPMS